MTNVMTNFEERFSTLEALVISQRTELEAQRAEIAELTGRLPHTERELEPTSQAGELAEARAEERAGSAVPAAGSSGTSRRSWLKGGAVAAGAAVVGATMAPRAAAAADGTSLIIGGANESAGGNTRLNGTGTGAYVDKNIFTVSDQNATSQFESAIGAYGEGDRVSNGIYAYTGNRNNLDGNTGYAVVATNAGGRANLLLNPGASDPNFDTYSHRRGAVRSDGGGNLWFCTNSGTPGTWRKLAGPASAGAVHMIAPSRVYDSRFADGPLASTFNRVVRVADRIDPVTGVLNGFNVVPAGATAIFYNVTITATTGAGFVLVSPGTATAISGSTVNWSGPNQTAANASSTTLDTNRNVRVFAGGVSGTTQFILDITGYTL